MPINFGLLDTNAPYKIATSFNEGMDNALMRQIRKEAAGRENALFLAAQAEVARKNAARDGMAKALRMGIVETPTTETITKPGYEYGGTFYDTENEALAAAGFNPDGPMTRGLGGQQAINMYGLDGSGKTQALVDFMMSGTGEQMPTLQGNIPVPKIHETVRDFQVPGQPKLSFDEQKAMIEALRSGDPYVVEMASNALKQYHAMKTSGPFGKVMPGDFTPESMAAFAKTGNYADLKPNPTSGYGKVNPGQFTPESLAVFAQSGDYADLVPRFTPQKIDNEGKIDLVDPATGRVISSTRKVLSPADLPSTKGAQESAKERAKSAVTLDTEAAKKSIQAEGMMPMITEAESILKSGDVTGSAIGSAVAYGKGAVGISDNTTQNNAKLKALSGWLTGSVPRFEGPQSDADRKYYLDMAGRVGDTTVPVKDRLAALQTVRFMQMNKMRPSAMSPSQPTGNVPPKDVDPAIWKHMTPQERALWQ